MKLQRWDILEKNGIRWVQDPAFTADGQILQAFCGRMGGASQGTYDSLNISFASGDDSQAIRKNRQLLAETLGFPMASWTGIRQVHGNRVIQVGQKEVGRGGLDSAEVLSQADGQITNIPGVTLISQHADCVPLFFWDPIHKAIGLSHAGWKGTLLDIAGNTIAAMAQAFDSKPSDLLAAIGPSAGPCHYEVDEPVIAKVKDVFGEADGVFKEVLLPATRPDRALLNLWQANRQLMLRHGIKEAHISISEICTICHQDTFFSHRGGFGGRQAAVLQLR